MQSPHSLQTSLTELGNALGADRAHIDALDRRARALQTSADSFAVVSTDVSGCIKLLDEIAAELAKEEEENAKNARQRDALTERGANVREVEKHRGPAAAAAGQMERAHGGAARAEPGEGRSAAKEKMEELRAVHKQADRGEGREGQGHGAAEGADRADGEEGELGSPLHLAKTSLLVLTVCARCWISRRTLRTRCTPRTTST